MTPGEYRTMIEAVREVMAEDREATSAQIAQLQADLAKATSPDAIAKMIEPMIEPLVLGVSAHVAKSLPASRGPDAASLADQLAPAFRDYLARCLAPIGERLRALEAAQEESRHG